MKLINLWAIDIHWAFAAIKQYADRMEEQIVRMAKEDRKRIEGDPRDEEEASEVWDQHYWLFEETLPRSHRYSCIVLLLTTIETTLLQICGRLERSRKLPLALGDLAGRPPEKMLTYINKVGGIALPEHAFRARLGHLLNVRDCIAHAAGNVKLARDPKAVREATRQLKGFSLALNGYIEIEKDACGRLVEEASAWESAILAAAGLAFRVERSERKKS